jgi:uncharacterized protein YcbK (DUF882 family)
MMNQQKLNQKREAKRLKRKKIIAGRLRANGTKSSSEISRRVELNILRKKNKRKAEKKRKKEMELKKKKALEASLPGLEDFKLVQPKPSIFARIRNLFTKDKKND